jgi:excinuclease UvrABC nuclease subunit
MKGLKIEYTIDNFSGIIDINDYNSLAPKSKKKGIYFLYSKNKELIYIGKSCSCIRGRLCNHLITVTPSIYHKDVNDRILEKRKECFYFAYSEIETEFVDMCERFLIQKYKPKFNIEFIYL